MTIKEIYNSYFNDTKTRINNTFDVSKKQTSNIIDNFEKNTIDQITNIVENGQEKKFKQELNNNLLNQLQSLIDQLNQETFNVINDITNKTNDVLVFTLTNPLFNITTCNGIEKEYEIKIKEINTINKTFIANFDNCFDFFLYRISVDYKLKDNVSIYNFITKVIKQNKKILLDNLYDINNLIKNESIQSFKNNFLDFTKDSVELREKTTAKNKTLLIDYSKNLLQDNVTLRVNKQLKSNCNEIKELLNNCYQNILKLQKSKDSKDKQIELQELNNYFINFNNTLFDKSLTTLNKMILAVDCDKKTLEKNINKYNESISKICNFDYSFERQFLNLKKVLLSKNPLSSKKNDEVIDLLNKTEKEIVTIIKKSIIDLFKDSMTELNSVSYKTIMIEYKLKDCYEVINKKVIDKLFA